MAHPEPVIQQSLSARLTQMHGHRVVTRALENLAADLVGAQDPVDLPADCRAWLDSVIGAAAAQAADEALEALLGELARSLAAAPDDLDRCDLMRSIARAQELHVLEVR